MNAYIVSHHDRDGATLSRVMWVCSSKGKAEQRIYNYFAQHKIDLDSITTNQLDNHYFYSSAHDMFHINEVIMDKED